MQRPVISLLLLISILVATAPSQIQAVVQPPEPSFIVADGRFGINFVNSEAVMRDPAFSPYVSLRYQQASAAGARWTRWPMYWNDIERSRGVRDYSAQDAVVNLDAQNGLQTHAILMFSPDWAATSGSPTAPFPKVGERSFQPLVTPDGMQLSSAISPPKNLDKPWNDPDNYWGQFVYSTVLRYKDRIKVWEMWNEPDGRGIVFWTGTVGQYYRLLKVGYQAAKAADPQATVLFGGLAYWGNETFFSDVLNYAANDPEARGAGFFFDVLPWHPYIDPSFVYDWAQMARNQMQAKGFVKPVWVNETNIPVCGVWPVSCNSWDSNRATLDEQASYVIQAYAYAFAADVQRLSIFQLWDDGLASGPDPEYYGLARNDGATRPAYRAYQVAATYLSHPSRVTRTRGADFENVALEGTAQGKVTVVWATQGWDVQVSIPASSVSARLVDQAGNVTNISPSGGYYRLTLLRATNNRHEGGRYIVGGKPYLLVEPVYGTLTSQITSLPAYASGLSFPVSWSRLDNSGVSAVFDIQYRIGTGSSWTDWLVGTTWTTATFGPSSPVAVQTGQTYYFRSRLRDVNGGAEQWPEGDGDTHTTAPVIVTGKVTDNRDIPLMSASVSAVGTSNATATDGSGQFRLGLPPGTYDLVAAVSGYGTIPKRTLAVISSTTYSFVLPPLNNYVQNWGFEGGVGEANWWATTGVVAASPWAHSGSYSAKLGDLGTIGEASISENNVIVVPAGTYRSTVSFVYAVLPSSEPAADDTLFLEVTGGGITTRHPIPLATRGTWVHQWFDLDGVSGPIDIRFRLNKARESDLRVFLDEVSVGKASGGLITRYLPQMWKG